MPSALKILFLIGFSLVSTQSWATITLKSVGGVSAVEQDSSNNVSVAYGGRAGDCTGDSSSTCDSCNDGNKGLSIRACNQKSVHPALLIAPAFSSDQTIAAAPYKITTTATGSTDEVELVTGNVNLTSGSQSSVSIPWGLVCDSDANFDSNCVPRNAGNEFSFANPSKKIFVYVNQNGDGDFDDDGEVISFSIRLHYLNASDASIATQPFCVSNEDAANVSVSTGICGFQLKVGDKKFVLNEIYAGANSQASGAPGWYGIALVSARDDINNVSNSSNLEVKLFDEPNAFSIADKNYTSGLENYLRSCMLLGNVNKAMNIYKFSVTTALPGSVCAEPSEVVGMLSDKNCFISTAAFGSDMAGQVQILRDFRDQFLIPHFLGRKFVKFYYQVSPPIAHFIQDSEILKSATRFVLYPIIAGAWLAVHHVWVLVLLALASLAFVARRKAIQYV